MNVTSFAGLVYPFSQAVWMQVRWMSKFTIWILDAVLLFGPVTNPGRIRRRQPIYVLSPEIWSRYVNVVQADPLTALNMLRHETNLGKKQIWMFQNTQQVLHVTTNKQFRGKPDTSLSPINLYMKIKEEPRK